MSIKKQTVSVFGSTVVALLSGCAPQSVLPSSHPVTVPSVLLRSSQMAAAAQHQVSEVLYVQSHPAVIAVAPSHALAVEDRFHFHWEGPLSAVGENLATAMGWNFVQQGPQPTVMPQVYMDAHNADVRWMIAAINRQAMPVAMLEAQPKQRSIVLRVPTPAQIAAWKQSGHCTVPIKSIPMMPATAAATSPKGILQPAAKAHKIKTISWKAHRVSPQDMVLTLQNGHVAPLPMFPKGTNIPLQTALAQHWKLVLPAHPTVAEKAVAEQWRKAGGFLFRS